jgi:6-phosphogluconolactonase (cycloisomerase 2 family)
VGVALAATGALKPRGCIDDRNSNGEKCARSTQGMRSAVGVATSRDGRSVYVVGSDDDAIVRFDRNRKTGALRPRGCVADNDSGPASCAQKTSGLHAPEAVAVSPDGRSVYTVSEFDNAVVRFDRNRKTGALTPKGCVEDNDDGPDGCNQSTDGLESAFALAVSPDGESLYAVSQGDDAIVQFARKGNGALEPIGCIDDNDAPDGPDACAESTNGLATLSGITVRADGEFVYTASANDNAIAWFDRDAATGALDPVGCIEDDDVGPDGCSQDTPALEQAKAVVASRDSASLCSVAEQDHAVAHFQLGEATGTPFPGECIDDPASGPETCAAIAHAMTGAISLALSRDGESLYTTSLFDDAIVRFDRDTANGVLSPEGCIQDKKTGTSPCAQEMPGLSGADGIAVSADGKSVYAASQSDNTLVRLKRKTGN